MEQSRTYRKNSIFRASAVLLCLVLISTWYLAGLFAKYTSSASTNDNAATATFVFDVVMSDKGETLTVPLDDITKPGDKSVYSIVITNKDNGVISAVAEQYTITMQLSGSMPLTCELKKSRHR